MEIKKNANIVICGSAKFIDDIHDFAKELENLGFFVIELYDVPYYRTHEVEEKIHNKIFYHKAIRNTDYVLVYNKSGYIGISTAMEIQFAIDCKKSVHMLFDTDIIELKSLTKSIYFNVFFDKRWLNLELIANNVLSSEEFKEWKKNQKLDLKLNKFIKDISTLSVIKEELLYPELNVETIGYKIEDGKFLNYDPDGRDFYFFDLTVKEETEIAISQDNILRLFKILFKIYNEK